MKRRNNARRVDGILVLDKPPGLTSNAALQRVKGIYFAQKAGHTGSLDPLATGVLPICFGEATKWSQYLLDSDEYERVMVFVNTKFMTQRVCDRLKKQGYRAEALHGDIRQSQRTRIMNDFKRGRFPILVSTDLAARGIDVDDVEAVINYDLPNEDEYYLHRIGRTGRARKHGVAFTMMTYQESVRMDEILRYMQTQPTPLHFDESKVLRREDGEAFFEHI